jgi:hypothetical protein
MSLATRGQTATAHFEVPQRRISLTASSTLRVDATTIGLETVGILTAEVRRVPVIGADQPGLKLDVGQADHADPRGRDQEVRVGSLVVHVLDAILGLIVLDAGSRLLRTAPVGAAPGERLVGARLTENAAI